MGRPYLAAASLALAVAAGGRTAAACDICAVYTATELRERRTGFRLGVAEQFTRFTTLQRDGEEIPNPAGERLTSSITQLVAGYNVTSRLGLQLNLPLISRTYRRLENGRVVRGDETGIGDLSLLGHALAYSAVSEHSVFRVLLLGGVKFPSGDSARLAEELDEHHHAEAIEFRPQHTGGGNGGTPGQPRLESGVHGHDLALGSGSYDGIVGGQLFWSWERFFATAAAQYAIRGTGDFSYRYANDLTWTGGPGVFALLTHRYSLGLQALLTGETKGKDRQAGMRLDDTGITALYAGPGLVFTWGTSLDAEVAADLPALLHNTGLQIVPDFRLRGGLTWRF